jgi:thiol-disulfide isomerase/thioredoxin
MMTRASWLILALAVLAAAAGGWLQHASRERRGTDLVGQPVPALQLPDLDGRTHALADYAGRRVLVNFWASGCGPCL